MVKIAFQSFNTASSVLPKDYDLPENKIFMNSMDETLDNNDYLFLGLQEERKNRFITQYKEIFPNNKISRQIPKRGGGLDFFQKIGKGLLDFFYIHKDVKLFCFNLKNNSQNIKLTSKLCKKACKFTLYNSSFFKGANIFKFNLLDVDFIVINTHLYFTGDSTTKFGLELRKLQFEAIFDYLFNLHPNDLSNFVIIMMGDLNFRFIRSVILPSQQRGVGQNSPLKNLDDYISELSHKNPDKKCNADQLCSYLTTQSTNPIITTNSENKNIVRDKIYKGFLESLKKSNFPISCRFKKKKDLEKNSLQEMLEIGVKSIKRDPSNCDKLIYYIPKNLEKTKEVTVSFTYNKNIAIPIQNSDHAFMNYGTLEINR